MIAKSKTSKMVMCAICTRTSGKILLYNEKTLTKNHIILQARQNHNLKYSDVVLPSQISSTVGYHVCCYKNFIAIKKQYYAKLLETARQAPFLGMPQYLFTLHLLFRVCQLRKPPITS